MITINPTINRLPNNKPIVPISLTPSDRTGSDVDPSPFSVLGDRALVPTPLTPSHTILSPSFLSEDESTATSSPQPNPQTPPQVNLERLQGTAASSSSQSIASATPSISLPTSNPNKVTEYSKLNRSDVNELNHNHDLLSHHQKVLIKSVVKKQQLYPQRYRDDYLNHSGILLLTNGWTSSQRYAMCSIPNRWNRSGQCRLHKYCPYCSYITRQQALNRYVPAFDHGNWFFVTGSFNGSLNMNGIGDYHDLAHYWDAYKIAFKTCVENAMVRGVFWTEELAVNSIGPVNVLPHTHALVDAECIDDELIIYIDGLVAQHLASVLGPDTLIPNIQVKHLANQRSMLSHLQYTIKPIKLVRAYQTAFSQAAHNDRSGVVALNSQTTDLVLGYSAASKRRSKINYAGNLNPKAKGYIGTKPDDMQAARGVVADVIKQGTDYIEMDTDEQDSDAERIAA